MSGLLESLKEFKEAYNCNVFNDNYIKSINDCIRTDIEFDNDIIIKKHNMEVENNENLRQIVNYNKKISDYNKTLVILNEKILTKIESLDDTLSFLNNVFNDKSKFDKEKSIEQNALLLELMSIIEEKDNNKLKKFMSDVGAPLGTGLLIEYLKMKFGLS